MRNVRTIGALAACLLGLLLIAGPAAAGGPTSVLLVSPGDGRTAALYHSDGAYTQLQDALGTVSASEAGAPGFQADPGNSEINVTWMIHDVSVWRIDRILLDYKDAMWVETRGSVSAPPDWESPGSWHKVKDPAAVRAVLMELKLIGPVKPAASKRAAEVAAQPAATATQPQAPTPPSDGLSWLWLIPVAALGLVVGAVARPAVSRLRDRTPRQQLIDVNP